MKYLLSFIAGSSMINYTQKVARFFLAMKDWDLVNEKVIQENTLQKRRITSLVRQLQEIRKRLINLSENTLSALAQVPIDEAKQINFIAMVKTYPILEEFVNEVIRVKWLHFDYELLESDFNIFMKAKATFHDELAKRSETTKAKIKQVLIRILAEVGLLKSTQNKIIQKPYVSETILEIIVNENPGYLKSFLFSDEDIKEIQRRFNKNENRKSGC